jgi:hypothetical protein
MPFGNAVGQGFVQGLITKLTIADLGPGDGFWVYSTATPMPNDLLMSFTASGGTDSAGNVYFQGLTVYLAGSTYYALVINGGSASWYTASSEAGPWTFQGELEASSSSSGTLFINFSAIAGTINVPQPVPGTYPVPLDNNSGTTWVSGERAFMNNNWVAFMNDVGAALVAAGIWN